MPIPDKPTGKVISVPGSKPSKAERDWHSNSDYQVVLRACKSLRTQRRYRLYLCACCRHFLWKRIQHEVTRRIVATAEQYADTGLDRSELRRAQKNLHKVNEPNPLVYLAVLSTITGRVSQSAREDLHKFIRPTIKQGAFNSIQKPTPEDQLKMCQLVRCIFGSPFHQSAIDPKWLTWQNGTVTKVAGTIYKERSFSALAVLADALEEAGCTDEYILGHCRDTGLHARGCWVIDMLLGKR